jgi:hypothetical protein
MRHFAAVLVLLSAVGWSATAEANRKAPTASFQWTAAVVDDAVTRAGFRAGFEPNPISSVELVASTGADQIVDVGVSLVGRGWFLESQGVGPFAVGRAVVGTSSDDEDILGTWAHFGFGVGTRPVPWLNVELTSGPEWTYGTNAHLRTEVSVGALWQEPRFKRNGPKTPRQPRQKRKRRR